MFSDLLGIDVGFSQRQATTGLAWSHGDGRVDAARTHTDWERRSRALPKIERFSVIAIDGPLLPPDAPATAVRVCEQILSRGQFQRRCKPGASHFGTGLQLRQAAAEMARQVLHLAGPAGFPQTVFPGVGIVEAFPNAFLGTLLPDEVFTRTDISRGGRFDWLYEEAVARNLLSQVMVTIGWYDPEALRRIETERDHEHRSAWICLLTAACAAAGMAERVGDAATGWIWLAPAQLWAPWARETLDRNREALA